MFGRLVKITVLLLAASGGCVYYGMDMEGKSCIPGVRLCPPGYRCVESTSADGGMVCKPGSVDGGTGDCTEGETQCADVERTSLVVCRSGEWRIEPCASGKYCFDAGGDLTAACISECDSSQDCSDLIAGYYCNTTNHWCEQKGDCSPPNEERCSMDGTQVLYCDPESGQDEVMDTCEETEYCHRSPPPVMCLPYCSDDLGCSQSVGTSCNLSSQRCVDMTLCEQAADCPEPQGSLCVGAPVGSPGACVIKPTEQATIPGGANPVLTCYEEVVTISSGPDNCALEGRVVQFFSRNPADAEECAAGPTVLLHSLEDILNGISDQPAHTGELTRVGTGPEEWQYSMEGVPTNTSFVMEVRCDAPQEPVTEYRTLYTFQVYIRAEDCVGPDFTYSFGAPVLYGKNYESYSGALGVTPDSKKGLVFGWLKDCQGDKLLAGTGGISMGHDLLYYLPSSGPPDPTATHTSSPGFFAAANALPIRGVASALVQHLGSPLSLRSRDFRVFPNEGSLVIFDRPKKPLP